MLATTAAGIGHAIANATTTNYHATFSLPIQNHLSSWHLTCSCFRFRCCCYLLCPQRYSVGQTLSCAAPFPVAMLSKRPRKQFAGERYALSDSWLARLGHPLGLSIKPVEQIPSDALAAAYMIVLPLCAVCRPMEMAGGFMDTSVRQFVQMDALCLSLDTEHYH